MTKEEIGLVLKELRVSCNMTQKEVAEKIGRTQQIVGHWETGYAQPDANTLFTLCSIYGVTVDDAFGFQRKESISKEDYERIRKYKLISDYSPDGAVVVDTVLDREYAIAEKLREQKEQLEKVQRMDMEVSEEIVPLRLWSYYGKIACAGTGFIFDDIPSDTVQAPDANADFIIGVNGDSMEPDYSDGEKLYIKKVERINPGEVGIFTINNECFLKEYGKDGLVSRNKKYDDIPGNEDVRLIGKVVGKVEE